MLKQIVRWFYVNYLRLIMSNDVVNLVHDWVEQGNNNSKKLVEIDLVQKQWINILDANLALLKSMNTDIDKLHAQVKKLSEHSNCPLEIFNEKTN